jgi:diacylglycerol kinase family enzyme
MQRGWAPLADAARMPAVVNTAAGTAAAAREALEASGTFDVRELAPADIGDAMTRLARAGAKRVLVAGGDGTVATAASALLNTGTELAILPGGTLNHFARDLGISTVAADALALASSAESCAIDVGVVNGRVFLNTSSVGGYVRYVRTRERLEGYLGYRLASLCAALRMATSVRRMSVEIEVDGHARFFRTPLVFIGVGERALEFPVLGGRVENGRRGLHVMVVKGRSRWRLVAIGATAILRGLDAVTRAGHFEDVIVDRLRITMHGAGWAALDGEIALLPTPLDYELRRGALSVVCPSPP